MRYLTTDTAKRISKIGLGTWQFGAKEWGYGEPYAAQEAHAIVRRALELGVTLFDTAEIYGYGRSERILGQALGDDLPSVFVATKILPVLPLAPVVEQRAVASANRLGARHLDLYQMHQPNPVVRDTPAMRGMRALQHVGLVGEVGVSNYSLDRWRATEAALGGRVLSNQVPYSLVDRDPERELLPYAETQDRVIIAYSPLAQGLLSGRYDANRRPANRVRGANPLFLPENLDRAVRADQHAARGGGRALGHPGPDRAGLGDPQPGGDRHPRRVQRRATGEQRGRGRHRADRRGARRAARGRGTVPAGDRPGGHACSWCGPGCTANRAQPRPMNGMAVAVRVRNCTLASSGRPAM